MAFTPLHFTKPARQRNKAKHNFCRYLIYLMLPKQKVYTISAKFQCCPQLQYGSHRIHYWVELSGGDILHQISLKWFTKYGKYINKIIYVLKYSKTVNEPIFTNPMPA